MEGSYVVKPENKRILLTGEEAVAVLKEINLILISLHKMGSYYADKDEVEYGAETTRFIDERNVTQRLAYVRRVLSEKFDSGLGEDDMDDLEREMENIEYWSPRPQADG